MEKLYDLEALMVSRNPEGIQQSLKSAKVAVAGLGGLGSNLAIMLARSGVGNLLLIDYDRVEPSNLNRQQYSIKHLGMYKTDAMLMQLKEINPYINIEIRNLRLDRSNIEEALSGYSIVCEAFDGAETKAELVNTVLEKLPRTYVVAVSGMAGMGSPNDIKTTRPMKRLYICGDAQTDASAGLTAPRAALCAAHQANTVLRIINELHEV